MLPLTQARRDLAAEGLNEFYKNYDPEKDRVWICEHHERMVGFLLLMHRENNAAQPALFFDPFSNDSGISIGVSSGTTNPPAQYLTEHP